MRELTEQRIKQVEQTCGVWRRLMQVNFNPEMKKLFVSGNNRLRGQHAGFHQRPNTFRIAGCVDGRGGHRGRGH